MPISEKEKNVKQQEKYQAILTAMLRDEDNKYCVDCDAKGPRWASWNLGIFLCIRCAGIHRNLGVHITKVKSVNLDQWTAEQIASMQVMGNSKARAVYEANLPDNYRRPQTDSALEQFIRGKYEQRKWIAKEWIPPNITISPDLTDEEPVKEKTKKNETKGAAAKETVKVTPTKALNERIVKKEDRKQPAAQPEQPVAAAQPQLLLDFDDIPQSASNTSNESNNSFGPFIGISSFDAPLSSTTTPTPAQQQPLSSGLNELTAPTPQPVQQQVAPPPSNSDLVTELNQKKAPLDKKDILALFNTPAPAATAANVAQPQFNMMQPNGHNQFAPGGIYPQLNPHQQQAHYQMPQQQYYGMNFQQQQPMPQMYANQPQFASPMTQYNQQQNQFNNLQMQMSNLNLNNPTTAAQQHQPAFAWPNGQQQHQQPTTTTANNNTQNLFNFNLSSLTNTTTNPNQTTLSSNLWQ